MRVIIDHNLSLVAVLSSILAVSASLYGQDASSTDVSPDQIDAAADIQQEDGSDRDKSAFIGTNAVHSTLKEDERPKTSAIETSVFEPWEVQKRSFYDKTGLKLGGDYNILSLFATDSPGDKSSAGGVLRFYGTWDLLGRGKDNTGSLVFKQEHRHRYTDVPPTGFGSELGYVGGVDRSHNNQKWQTTNLYWRQHLFDQRLVTFLGFMDVTDYADVYAFSSGWTTFTNEVFGSGSGTMGGKPSGALGAMAGVWVTDTIYTSAGLADINADSTQVFDGFDTFFGDFNTFKSLEVGYAPDRELLFVDNMHVTFWQVDESDAGTPDGWGVSASASSKIGDKWMPFLRGGWAHDGGSPLEGSVSVGVGYQPDNSDDLLAVGLNWGRPNHDTYGTDLDDQFTSEIFYRWQAEKHLQITPSVQLLANPALNPDDDFIAVFGLRARVVF